MTRLRVRQRVYLSPPLPDGQEYVPVKQLNALHDEWLRRVRAGETEPGEHWSVESPVSIVDGRPMELAEVRRLLMAQGGDGPGRPSEQAQRIDAIVDKTRDMGPVATKQRVAEALGRVDADRVMQSGYKGDVRAAGGWQSIKRLAGF